MELVATIRGRINPKSIEASGTGLFFAQNNIYRHSITVYDRDFELVKTIRDRIVLSEWGFPQYDEPVRGGPVEAAFSPDGTTAYVTMRSMYGPGFPRPGPLVDACSPSSRIDRSFVWEIDVATLRLSRVIRVGSLPKDLTVTPDGRYVLVSNWCSYDLSVVDLARGEEVERVPIGPYPRGIAVDSASRYAYVAQLGSDDLARVDLRTFEVRPLRDVGPSGRDVLMSPDDRFLYVSLDQGGGIVKYDIERRRVVDRARTGQEPRSMAMAPDGRSVYVVNWASGTATKVRTSDMRVLQRIEPGYHPIGITYDAATRQVWVSTYPGLIRIYQEQ
jgi:YVTN family beta-propeller protein